MAACSVDWLASTSIQGIATYPPGATFGPRRMRDFEFVWLIDGECRYEWDGHEVLAPQGSIVLCRDGTRDGFEWDRRRWTHHAYVTFRLLRRPPELPPVDRWPVVVLPSEGDALRPLFRQVLTQRGGDCHDRLTLAHMLSSYVGGLADTRAVTRAPLPAAVRAAHEHIWATLERDPAARITLAELARATSVSAGHLCRLFAGATGHSPVETVRLARLDRAATLVTRSNLTLKEVARLCGFGDPYHFSKRFRRAFGASPSQVRADVRAGRMPPPHLLLDNPARPRLERPPEVDADDLAEDAGIDPLGVVRRDHRQPSYASATLIAAAGFASSQR